MEQYTIFGDIAPEIKEPEKNTRRYKKMQEKHGTLEGKTCKDCKHLLRFDYHDRIYYKCELWIVSHSTATDVRLKDKACGLWEREVEKG
jgi:hypothetical protein